VPTVEAALRLRSIDPALLLLEITETALTNAVGEPPRA
jgi:hypothetical protein